MRRTGAASVLRKLTQDCRFIQHREDNEEIWICVLVVSTSFSMRNRAMKDGH